MARRRRVQLFCEDQGHEQVGTALLRRFAREAGVPLTVEAPCARGGRGRALTELKVWGRAYQRGARTGVADALVVLIDGNCEGAQSTRREIERQIEPGVWSEAVIGVPDPHVERWLIADPEAFARVVGVQPPADPGKCGRDVYKRLIRGRVEEAGVILLSNVMELAPEIVDGLDPVRVARTQPTLGSFVGELQSLFRRLADQP